MKKFFLRLPLLTFYCSLFLNAQAAEKKDIEDPLPFKSPAKTLLISSGNQLLQYNPTTLQHEQTYPLISPPSFATSKEEYIFIANKSVKIFPYLRLSNKIKPCDSIPFISQIDTIKRQIISFYPLEKNPIEMVVIGDNLYVQEENNQITEISISQRATIKKYPILTSSYFTISPSKNVLLISFLDTNQISILDPSTQSITSCENPILTFNRVKSIGRETFFSDCKSISVFNNQFKKMEIISTFPENMTDWLNIGNTFAAVNNKNEFFTSSPFTSGTTEIKKVIPYEQIKVISNRENIFQGEEAKLSYTWDNIVSLGNKYIAVSTPRGIFKINLLSGKSQKIYDGYYQESVLELESDANTLFFYTKGSTDFYRFNMLNSEISKVELQGNFSINNIFLF